MIYTGGSFSKLFFYQEKFQIVQFNSLKNPINVFDPQF